MYGLRSDDITKPTQNILQFFVWLIGQILVSFIAWKFITNHLVQDVPRALTRSGLNKMAAILRIPFRKCIFFKYPFG